MAATPELLLAELQQINAKLDALLNVGEAPLTIAEFARRSHVSRATVKRRIADKTIVLRKGKIPYSVLRDILS